MLPKPRQNRRMDLFSKPSIPQPDPKIAAMRDAEEKRAEQDRIKSIQEQLGLESKLNSGSGLRSLLGPLGTGSGGIRSLLGAG